MRKVTTSIEIFEERKRIFFVDDDSKSWIGSIVIDKNDSSWI